MFKLKYYFSLQEALNYLYGVDTYPYDNIVTFDGLLENLDIQQADLPFNVTNYVRKLWRELYALNYDEIIYIKDNAVFNQNDLKKWVYKMLSIISRTYEYYAILLKNYEEQKDKLLDDIKSGTITSVKYNDTPQSTNDGFDEDNYTTNITNSSSETTTPFASPMEKLKTLENNFTKLYNKWCKEFSKIFIEEN